MTSVDQRHQVVVIGLDMGDGALIRAWCQRGDLPNLAALVESGTWFDLESPARVLHTSTWPTFATGTLPGRHGVYYPYQPRPGFQEAQLVQPDQYGVPTFWKLADQQGRRCLVYDVPETFPESGFGGKAIFEWGTWAWYGQRCTQPDALLRQMKQRFGVYPLKMEAKKLGAAFPEPKLLEQRLVESIDHKRATFEWLLEESVWDLAVMVFGETHPAGHYLWPPGVKTWSGGEDDREFAAVRRVYQAIDAAIGSIRASLAPDAVFMVVSGDGATVNHCGWHLVPDVLERLGYLVAPQPAAGASKGTRRLSVGALKDLLPQGARRWIADNLPWWLRDRIGARMRAENIDWTRTRAFVLPTDLEGCIRINLQGREPKGIVTREEYDGLCREIAASFAQLKHPDSGEPAVRRVWIRNEVFPGPAQEFLPDIIVSWDDAAAIDALASPETGMVARRLPDPRMGTHSTEGFCVLCGDRYERGASSAGRLEDVAPTLLSLVGAHADGLDGKPLTVLR